VLGLLAGTCCLLTGCIGKPPPMDLWLSQEQRDRLQAMQTKDAAEESRKAPETDEVAWTDKIKWPWEWELFQPKAPPGPADSLVLRGDKLEAGKAVTGKAATDLSGAHVLFRNGDYATAEKIFHRIAGNTKNPPGIAEEARYYEAESLFLQGKWPKAADTYEKMLLDFPSGNYREQAVQRMFTVANYWLDDTRTAMIQTREKNEGQRWIVWPHFFNWHRSKPLLDEEGRALEKLEQVRYNDMTGPLADKALFLLGSVKFFNADYKESDHYFSQLVEMHPNSEFAEQAVELGIISKHLSTGGSDYDGRKVAEARMLVDTALRNYPGLAGKKEEFLTRQLIGITLQQAEKDFKVAEFYRRTGHPGAAWFYYEIVRRRYPLTEFADKATQRMHELRSKLEKQQARSGEPAMPPVAPLGAYPQNLPQERPDLAPPARPQPPVETAPAPRPVPPGMPPEPRPLPLQYR
jgi:outer membrane protein assembly factor BamD (BamD/ComL family)